MIDHDELATLRDVHEAGLDPAWAATAPFDRAVDPTEGWHTRPEALEEALRCRIAQRTWGRLRNLHVEVDIARVVVRGTSPTYYLKQLALSAVQEVLPATSVELDIQVTNTEPRLACPGYRQASRGTLPMLALVLAAGLVGRPARAEDLERAPIHYNTAPVSNAVARLQQRLDAGKVSLVFDEHFGYLPSLLRTLEVPVSSQVLVFSKTSMQRDRISPRRPRALYFRDDVYIGYCQAGRVLEVSAADPGLGTVFYTLEQTPAAKPRFQRQNDACLICHGSSQNQGFPGHLLRSVYADGQGFPILSFGSFRIDQTSPLKQRWGGWYVTGTSGDQAHMGNLIVREESTPPARIQNAAGLNVTDLSPFCRTSGYLSRHSDIVALMVLEHQTEMHNLIVRAGLLTRLALYEEADLNKALGRPADYRSDLTVRRIESACEPLVKYLLFSGEAKLTAPVRGTSGFAQEFARRGPRDRRGRSLQDLDLRTRLFRYPCSYLVYGEAFDMLPAEARDYVVRRLWDVLGGQDTSADFAHLSAADRSAILAILRETKPNLPDYWRAAESAAAP